MRSDFSNLAGKRTETHVTMKMVVAIIQPFQLDAVKGALSEHSIMGMTVTEVRGVGRQRGHTAIYRGAEYKIDLVPKLRLDIAVDEAEVRKVVELIEQSARTGKIGDGKIFVLGLDEAVRIRTGERGREAL